jgi:hypothetical protein
MEQQASQQDPQVSRSRNLPPFSTRDLAGLVVAIVGTIALGIIAASCGHVEEGSGSSPSCGAVIGIALAVGLINAAHVVGLFLFESVGYHGFFAPLFATLSLVLTPLAIIVTLLLH